MTSSHQTFGQEFYPHESIRALRLADKTRLTDRRALIGQIALGLPQPSAHTRRRVAEKLVQRYFTGSRLFIAPPPQAQPFVRLVARQRHAPAQIELLYLRLAQIDTLVGALAREIFYPVCITHRPPAGLNSAEFAARNGGQLFGLSEIGPGENAMPPQITRGFLHEYAREHWNFNNAPTLDRALRVLQAAGMIARERMSDLPRHPAAYRLSNHDVALPTFVWALYDEFLPHAQHSGGVTLAPGVLKIADFARTLLLNPAQVEMHCDLARRRGFLAAQGPALRLTFGNLDVLADALLSRAL